MRKHKAYLFKVGHSTYGLVTYSQTRAYAYLREVMRVKKGQYEFLGVDNSTHKAQSESFTIGVKIADDWEPASVYMARWARKDRSFAKALEAKVISDTDQVWRR